MPGLLGPEIHVHLRRHGHRELQRVLKPRLLELFRHRSKGRLAFFDERPVRLGQRLRLRNSAEVSICVDQSAVHEVAPRGDQLVVVAAHELIPREVRVLVLRTGNHQVVAESVRVVPVEEVSDKDHLPTPARRKLLAAHVQVLGGDDVVGQLEPARAHQDRRPQHRVERDVVLPHHVVVP